MEVDDAAEPENGKKKKKKGAKEEEKSVKEKGNFAYHLIHYPYNLLFYYNIIL